MKRLITLTMLLYATISHAQYQDPDKKFGTDPKWSDKYMNVTYTVYEYLDIAKKVKWTPKKDGRFKGSYKLFEEVFLEVSHKNGFIKQLNIEGMFYCAKNHDILFDRYNELYTPIDKVTWDEYCPMLYSLMHTDEQ
jgi:hypothetical protein